jgi:hypothetical protein
MISADLSLQLTGSAKHLSRDGFREIFMKKFYDPARRGERQALVHLEMRVWQDYRDTFEAIAATEVLAGEPE